HGRGWVPANEVTLDEDTEIGVGSSGELGDRASPEDAADNRGGLQRTLLGRTEHVDSGRDDRWHGVGKEEALGQLVDLPAAVETAEESAIDERSDKLLDEERVALGVCEDEFADLRWKPGSEQFVEHLGRVLERQ